MNSSFIKSFLKRLANIHTLLRGARAAIFVLATWSASDSSYAQTSTPADNNSYDGGQDTASMGEPAALSTEQQQDLPHLKLTSQIIFEVLAAEIALQRDQPAPAYQTYLALMRETRDPRMAQRAVEIALGAQSLTDALTAARLWHQSAPSSQRAAQLETSLLVLNGNLGKAQPLLAAELARVPESERGTAILSLQSLISRSPDQIGGLDLLKTLLKNDMQRPEAQLAIARQQFIVGDQPAARQALETALKLKPDFEAAALLLAQMGPDERQKAIHSLQSAIAQHATSRNVRIALAQLYLADNQFDAAQRQFKTIHEQDPTDLTALLALALIDIDRKQYDNAKTYLRQYAQEANRQIAHSNVHSVNASPPDPGQAYFYLAQISFEQHNSADTLKWLDKISVSSQQYVPAQLMRAQVLSKQGKIDEAHQLLANLPSRNPGEEVLIARTDASILIESNRYEQAEARLAQANKRFPNDPALLYDYAMAAERNHHYALMETQLRRLMTLQPDNVDAYNALGYSLADRGERLDEASKLIEKAASLSPDNAYVIDSLGWVKYRLGDKQAAVNLLEQAFKLQPNAEIGAHLGEVLWSLGRPSQAKTVWRAAKKFRAGDETLLKTLKRFQIDDL